MKITIILMFVFMYLFSVNANADITALYRADSRPPEEIFEKGFTAQGTNTDLVSHVLGLTTNNLRGNSAFIPTSVNIRVPMQFVIRSTLGRGRLYYIYNIRPTDNIYFTANAIHTLYDYVNVPLPSDIRYILSSEAEYSALSHISPTQIRSVTAYIRNSNFQVVESYTRDNPNYIEANTHINDGSNTPRDWIRAIPNQGAIMVYIGEEDISAYQAPADLLNEYRPWTQGCFSFVSNFTH